MTSPLTQPRANQIPIGAIGSVSHTNFAYDCFVGQQFSSNLQAYLLSYIDYVTSYFPVPINTSSN